MPTENERPRRIGDGGGPRAIRDQQTFERLLGFLDPNRERAGEVYERLRRRLMRFFQWHGCEPVADLADQTIDRVCQKIQTGSLLEERDPVNYFYGVARMLLHEHWHEEKRRKAAVRLFASRQHPTMDPAVEARGAADREALEGRLRCLEGCLAGLAAEDREMIVEYYKGQKDVKIANRKALAERLGIGLNALRIRAFRLRARLDACVEECLERDKDLK